MGFSGSKAGQGAMTGAVAGAPFAGATFGLSVLGGAAAGSLMGFMGDDAGPDYSNVTNQYKARNIQIGEFAASLANSRAKYMTSLNNMYADAYSRFSGNAEAGFANRGLSVSGGAFASTLARETGRMSFEGANIGAGMERDDIKSVDNAYGANSGSYMNSISGGPALQYQADRQDSAALGGFAMNLGSAYLKSKMGGGAPRYNAYTDPNSQVPDFRQNSQDRLDINQNRRVV